MNLPNRSIALSKKKLDLSAAMLNAIKIFLSVTKTLVIVKRIIKNVPKSFFKVFNNVFFPKWFLSKD